MKIAIIGCGYVGTAVARYWTRELGFEVTVTTTTPEKVPSLEAIPAKAMVTKGSDFEGLNSVLKEQDAVLLCVGSRFTPYEDTYLKTAQNLTSILPHIPSIKQVIYTGSYGIYGNHNGNWVDENSPLLPQNENGKILAQTEQILQSANREDCQVCLLRLGGIYGPNRELIKIFRRAAGSTRPGDGSSITNWVHLDDIVGAIEFARKQQLQGTYNLVDGLHLTSQELLDRVMEKHELPKISWDASQESPRSYNAKVSNQKLKDAGYIFIHPQLYDADT